MRERNSWLTPKEAASLAGVTARTINNYIVKGALSASKEDNRYYIDKSEFYRVFPHCFIKKEDEKNDDNKKNNSSCTSETENRFLKEALIDKEKQNDYFKGLIQNFTQERTLMLQTINSHTRMLESKTAIPTSWFSRIFHKKKP